MLRRLQLFLIVTLLVGLAACGSSGNMNPPPNPVPSISANNPTSPSSAVAGSGAFSLTVNGSGFVSSSQVQWNGSIRATTFVSGAQLQAAILATDVATPGTASVTVTSPPPGGGTSNAFTFTITAGPTVTLLSPPSGPVGTSVTITGTNFGATQGTSTVKFNGMAATSIASWSATSIMATVPAGATTGSVVVTVGGVDSNGVQFTVTAPAFSLTVSEAGTGSGTVTSSPAGINCPGTCTANYNSGTVVTLTAAAASGSTFTGWSGACSGTGTCSVTMSVAKSVTATFSASATLTSISPTTIGANTPGFLLTLKGSGLTTGSTVQFTFNGTTTDLTPNSATSDQKTATVVIPTAAIVDSTISTDLSATVAVVSATGTQTLTVRAMVKPQQDALTPNISTLSNSNPPIRLAFDLGDNSLFVAEQQTGNIDRVTITNGTGVSEVGWATVANCRTSASPCTNSDLGLLGMAIDQANPPSKGGSVYVFYTAFNSSNQLENRIGTISKSGSVVPFPNIILPVAGQANSSDQPYLNGGKLAVHLDPTDNVTYIYASTGGSDYQPALSQALTDPPYGKILRYDTSGNPAGAFSGTAVYACGFRNSFGFDFHPSGALYATDNGDEASVNGNPAWYDGLDRVKAGGGNAEGFGYSSTTSNDCTSPEAMPLLGGSSTGFATNSHVPTGTIFYTNPSTQPNTIMPQFENNVLVVGNYAPSIYAYAVDEYDLSNPVGSVQVIALPSDFSYQAVYSTDLVQGPDGCIYVSGVDINTSPLYIYRFTAQGGTCQ
jgi:glucose/arabinose dehydrogenase